MFIWRRKFNLIWQRYILRNLIISSLLHARVSIINMSTFILISSGFVVWYINILTVTTYRFSFFVSGSQFFTFIFQSAKFELKFVQSAVHVSQLILSVAKIIYNSIINIFLFYKLEFYIFTFCFTNVLKMEFCPKKFDKETLFKKNSNFVKDILQGKIFELSLKRRITSKFLVLTSQLVF